jgi:hypothetical protein
MKNRNFWPQKNLKMIGSFSQKVNSNKTEALTHTEGCTSYEEVDSGLRRP